MLKYIFYLLIIIQFAYSDSKSRLFYSLNYSKPYFSIDTYKDYISTSGKLNHTFGYSIDGKIVRVEFSLSGRTYFGETENELIDFLENSSTIPNVLIKDSHTYFETGLTIPFQIPLSFINSTNAGSWDLAIGYKFSYPLISYREIDGEKFKITENCLSNDCIKGTINNDHGIVLSSSYSSPYKLGITLGFYIGFRNIEDTLNDNSSGFDSRVFGLDFISDFDLNHRLVYVSLTYDI